MGQETQIPRITAEPSTINPSEDLHIPIALLQHRILSNLPQAGTRFGQHRDSLEVYQSRLPRSGRPKPGTRIEK